MLRKVLMWLWQFPQNTIGFIISRFSIAEYYAVSENKKIKFYYVKKLFHSAVSLGDYRIVDTRIQVDNSIELHEYGHSIQSKIFGIFYLFIVGLPSLFGNIYDRIAHKKWSYERRYNWYHNLWWERMADELGKNNE